MLQIDIGQTYTIQILSNPWHFITMSIAISQGLKDHPIDIPFFSIVSQITESAFQVGHIILLGLTKSGFPESPGALELHQIAIG